MLLEIMEDKVSQTQVIWLLKIIILKLLHWQYSLKDLKKICLYNHSIADPICVLLNAYHEAIQNELS